MNKIPAINFFENYNAKPVNSGVRQLPPASTTAAGISSVKAEEKLFATNKSQTAFKGELTPVNDGSGFNDGTLAKKLDLSI
ncbi:MAG: hypothetical protein PHV68_08245 [Candidatus Gastranaerophilales bacterium]|nr:hypothetical protein [Candidatus Gastranaerophilales bacterium]